MFRQAKKFCLNSSLHGYRFIALPKRTLLERVFWIIIVLLSLAAAVTLLFLAWFSFQKNPTILVTDSTVYPIWHYSFPAITVCNFNTMSKKTAYELAEQLLNNNSDYTVDELAKEFRILAQLVRYNDFTISLDNFTKLHKFLMDNYKKETHELIRALTPSCKDTLIRCKWKSSERRCESLFEMTSTFEGFCCTFNYYALRNHTFQGLKSHKMPATPRRVASCGHTTALEVVLNNDRDDYFASRTASVGNRIMIHNAYDFPGWNAQTILAPSQTNTFLEITPTKTYSTSGIRELPVEQRQCLFRDEKMLLNFAVYTYQNCIIECRMNLTKKTCGCVPFYYYNPSGLFPKTRICGLKDLNCLFYNRNAIRTSVPGMEFSQKNFLRSGKWEMDRNECNCLPDCEYTEYLGEYSNGKFTKEFNHGLENLFNGIKDDQAISVVRIFFDDLVSTRNRRDVTYSWQTLLAYYGGLLGLFVGFSFISGVEVVYFFTVRLVSDYLKKRSQLNKGVNQKVNVKTINVNEKPNRGLYHVRL